MSSFLCYPEVPEVNLFPLLTVLRHRCASSLGISFHFAARHHLFLPSFFLFSRKHIFKLDDAVLGKHFSQKLSHAGFQTDVRRAKKSVHLLQSLSHREDFKIAPLNYDAGLQRCVIWALSNQLKSRHCILYPVCKIFNFVRLVRTVPIWQLIE